MAGSETRSPLLQLPRELRDHIYETLYVATRHSNGLHIHVCRPVKADKQHPELVSILGLPHTCQQLRHEALPILLDKLKITIHAGPPAGLHSFMITFPLWLPHIRRLCIAGADAFLQDRAHLAQDPLQQLFETVSRQNGGSLRELVVSLPREEWNTLAGASFDFVVSLWLFRKVLQLRGLDSFGVQKPVQRTDRPRWGRKPSWDVVARRMGEQKWREIEDRIEQKVTMPVAELCS